VDWKSILGSVAPTLATAAGGPLVGTAVKLLGGLLLGRDDAPEAEVQKAIASGLTPDQIVALKKLDADFRTQMLQAGVKLEELAVDDRKDARLMQRETKSWAPGIIACFVLACWGAAQLGLVVWGMPPKTPEPIVTRVLGMLDAAALLVLYFFFGSSARSAQKDDTIKTLATR
jgi:hypothetical protein